MTYQILFYTNRFKAILNKGLKSLLLLVALIIYSSLSKAQSLTITSPSTNPVTYALGASIPLSATATPLFLGSVTNVTYTLSTLTPVVATASPYSGSFSTSTLALGSYTLTATMNHKDLLGFVQTPIVKTVTVNIIPSAPILSSSSTCIGSAAVISLSGGAPSGGTYVLYDAVTGGTTLSTTTGTSIVTPVITATTTYYISYVSGAFESTRTAITITANASPATPSFTATSTVATGANATITLTSVGGLTYSWDFSGGTPATGAGTGPFSVSWATAGAKLITVTATNAGGCSTKATQTVIVTKTIASGNYAFNQPITLTATGAAMGAAVNNFPVLVYIKEDALKSSVNCATNVKFPTGGTNGYDFAFTTVGGTNELFYQVESFDGSTGTLLAWVQVPTLNTTTTSLIFYFGSLAPAHPTSFGNATWGTDYQAVYHFGEAAAAGTTTADGTANLRTGTTSGLTAASNTTGIIGSNAYTFNGSSTRIAVSAVNIASSFTLSAWIKLNAINSDQKIMTNQTSAGSASGGYKLGVYSDNTIEVESPQINRGAFTPAAPVFTTTGWHYVQGVFNTTDNTLRNYVDGAVYKIASGATTIPSSLNPFYIGAGEGGNGLWFNGIIDEVRVSNIAKSSDWIKAEYYNQVNYLTFTNSTAAINVVAANATAIGGSIIYTWTGATSTATNVATNWTIPVTGNPVAAIAPPIDGTASLVIPNVTNKPILAADASFYGITIAANSSLSLNNKALTIGCNVYNNGTMNAAGANTSTLAWNGTFTPQLYTGNNVANTAQFGNFIVNNTAASGIVRITGGPVNVYTSLTLTNGSLDINNAGSGALTLKSSQNLTANVSPITSGSVTGNVSVERYVTGGTNLYRGYRVFSSPVYDAVVNGNNVSNLAYLKNTAYVTGTSTTGGFDNTVAANPTIYLYREDTAPVNTTFITGNFRGVNKINNSPLYSIGVDIDGTFNLPAGNGIMFFFRGDRITNPTPTVTSSVATPAVFTTTGILNQGLITVKDWFTPTTGTLSYTTATANSIIRGFNLVGNPYASAIDWDNFLTAPSAIPHSAQVSNTIYRYNVKVKGYSVYMAGNGGVATNFAASQANIIQSGEGFYVRGTAAGATLGFNEAAKISTQVLSTNSLMATSTPEAAAPLQYMRLKLVKDSVNTDDALFFFRKGASTDFIQDEDASYLAGAGVVSLSSKATNNVNLAINRVELPANKLAIPLNVNMNASGLYQLLLMDVNNIPDMYDVWLLDAFKKDSLDMRKYGAYNFNTDLSNSATYGSSRFSLLIRQNPAYALRLLDFKGDKMATGARLSWITEHESTTTNFTVERSTDNGKSFEVIGGFASNGDGNYKLMDPAPIMGLNQYRLKQDDLNGKITYSKLVNLMYAKADDPIIVDKLSVYPNPAVDVVNMAITTQTDASSYNVKIINGSGVLVKSATSNQPTWQNNVSDLKPGTYFVQVTNNSTKALVGTSKFIKK